MRITDASAFQPFFLQLAKADETRDTYTLHCITHLFW